MTPAPKGMPSPSAPAPHSPAPATPTPCSAPCVRSCPIGMVLGVIAIDRPGRVYAVAPARVGGILRVDRGSAGGTCPGVHPRADKEKPAKAGFGVRRPEPPLWYERIS